MSTELRSNVGEGGVAEGLDGRAVSVQVGGLFGVGARWVLAFVAQGISSTTTFALSVLVGRTLGAADLGVVVAGFAAYLMFLLLHRALVTTPLISTSSGARESVRNMATNAALSATVVLGVLGAAVLALVGTVLHGPIGLGLLMFAPWLLPALTQDMLRASLFRDGLGRRAALTDAAWLGMFALTTPLALWVGQPWAFVAAWGSGSIVATGLGMAWTGARGASLSNARRWFLIVALPFGRWLALQEASFVAGFYALVVILTAMLGAASIGGLRAAETIFTPMTFLAPALVLVGLPTVARSLARSRTLAVRRALTISAGCVLLTLAYVSLLAIAGTRLLVTIFGKSFEQYGELVIPMSAWQLGLAAGIGFTILLRAEQRGKALFLAGTLMSTTSLVLSPLLAARSGLDGAVWGFGAGAVVYTTVAAYLVLNPDAHSEGLP